MAVPETRYARRSDGVHIGYQMLGSGPATLVWCWGWISHLDLFWADAGVARMFERVAGFCRLVLYDKPGTGVSDPILHVPTLEERVEDVRVVMDAAGIEHAAILGESEAGPVAAMERSTAMLPKPAHDWPSAPRSRLWHPSGSLMAEAASDVLELGPAGPMRDALVASVLNGEKTATSSLLVQHEEMPASHCPSRAVGCWLALRSNRWRSSRPWQST